MAENRDQQGSNARGHGEAKDESPDSKRVVGRGMTSPDSTEVPLRSEDAEPDLRAVSDKERAALRDEEERR
jgi:hypothetical protein